MLSPVKRPEAIPAAMGFEYCAIVTQSSCGMRSFSQSNDSVERRSTAASCAPSAQTQSGAIGAHCRPLSKPLQPFVRRQHASGYLSCMQTYLALSDCLCDTIVCTQSCPACLQSPIDSKPGTVAIVE